MKQSIKNWLKQGLIGLCAVWLVGFSGIEGKQLAQVQAEQNIKYNVDKKPLAVIQEQTTPDKFTQTTAHLQVKNVKKLLMKEASSKFIPYLDTIADCLEREQKLKNTHYAFYHTTENEWRLAQDVYSQLFAKKNPEGKKIGENFVFIRFNDPEETNARDFLVDELQENGLVDDNGKVGALLLSVNLSLFGNIGFESECTWEYFLRERKHRIPTRKDYEDMMTKFGVTHKYIDELMALTKIYDTNQKTLLQIFVPQNRIDEIGYLAWATGIPKHEETIAWVNNYVKKKSWEYKEGRHAALWGLEELGEKFKKEQEKNTIFKDLIESVKTGDFSLKAFLKIYRNNPWEVSDINHAQARLIFTPGGLLNPAAGVKFYRYSTASKKQLKEYYNRLNVIMDKIFTESEGGAHVNKK